MARAAVLGVELAILALVSGQAAAVDISGKVVDADGGLQFVRLRITGRQAVPYSITVFSTGDGTFAAHYESAKAEGLQIEAFRIGWREVDRTLKNTPAGVTLEVKMRRVANVADEVPASAWLKGDPSSQGYQMATLQCSNCHQLGSFRVRRFSSSLAELPVGDRSEAWVKRAADDLAGPTPGKTEKTDPNLAPAHGRVGGWESIVQYMRLVTTQLGEKRELRWGLSEGSPAYAALLQPDTSLFSPRDMAIVVPYLARNYPVVFDTYTDYDDVERLGEYAVNKNTRLDEFVLPTYGWTREVALAPGSDKVWFVETDKDRLGALDPKDGSVTWYPIPGAGRQGPHTMNADAHGNIWTALEDSFNVGRFDTKTSQWRLYPPPAGTTFGVTHDFAFDASRFVEPDPQGRIWITDMGKNELRGVNIETGEAKNYRMPVVEGETHFHSLLYGAALDSKHNRVWYAQLYGYVGSFDTEHNIAERILPFRRGEGPRRLAIQEDGTLWIPLFGSSQLVKVDGDTGRELGRYQIPDRGASPYGVTYDKKRNAVWAATSNSDRIYRFDVDTQKWRHYPLPRKETYIRMIELDRDTGDLWTTYSSLPVGRRDVAMFGTPSANNMIVRLHPGD
jgi:streptogramin lyase